MITLADFQADWGVTDQTVVSFLTRTITRCSSAAAHYCKRVFGLESVRDIIVAPHSHWPSAASAACEALFLSRWPVVTVNMVIADGAVLIAGQDFIVDAINGRLLRLNGSGAIVAWQAHQTTVEYSAGYLLPSQNPNSFPTAAQPLPADLADAVSRMVYTRYAERRRDPLVKSEFIEGIGRIEYLVSDPEGNLSPDVAQILDHYRAPTLA